MKIKNISGAAITIGLGIKVGITMANNAIATVNDFPDTVADALVKANAGTIEIIEAPAGSELTQSTGVPQHLQIDIATPLEDQLVTIGSEVFQWSADGTITAGNVWVNIGADSNAAAINLASAIDNSVKMQALGISTRDIVNISSTLNRIIVMVDDATTLSTLVATAPDAPTTVVKASTVAPITLRLSAHEYTVTAADVTATYTRITTGLLRINYTHVSAVTAAGVNIAYTGKVVYHNGTVVLDATGATDLAATDIVTVLAYGF